MDIFFTTLTCRASLFGYLCQVLFSLLFWIFLGGMIAGSLVAS